ncbi:MAG: hypothetical protein HOO90_03035 [Methylotenera sp.]|uniref:hypothetical protein n=1 Tax=Methylotenera sp. TaxID=2051956 RepID=UPI0017ED7D8C|nr:hypothetical protein [Methylotenera sp.]NOU24492.1 hypothetical protein [Methylotenera sp.]
MISKKVIAKNSKVVNGQKNNRALSLLLDDMAVWFPFPYQDVEAMVNQETKGFRASRSA